MKYKAMICDVDGTLIPNTMHGMPSKKLIDTINKAKGKIPIGIATARSQFIINHIIDALGLTAPCIITGGAQIIDPTSKKILKEIPLANKDVEEIIRIGKKFDITFTVADSGYGEEVPVSKNYKPIKVFDMYSQILDVEQAQEFIQKISHLQHAEAHKALGWEQHNKVHVVITHPLASKQHGVLEVAKILNISPKEIIGIGEGYNDFSFLMACGFKVAMGNAIDAIKAIADYVAPSVEDDGVADVIEKFVLAK